MARNENRLNLVVDQEIRDAVDRVHAQGFSQRVIVQAGIRMLTKLGDKNLIGVLLTEMARKNGEHVQE